MGEPYLWRTANMSPRTCVVVKQMQSNPGDEELVPEREYDVFRQAVWISLGWFHSSGDNADDFVEIRSLIPTDEVLKDKITWGMQSSFKASLTHCAKISQ